MIGIFAAALADSPPCHEGNWPAALAIVAIGVTGLITAFVLTR